MPSPLFKYGYASAPYMQGGFTNLLLGIQEDAAMSSLSARKLNFDENM